MFRDEVRTIVEEIIETSKKDKHISAVYLFGSQARGESTINSDVDIAIVSDDPSKVNRVFLNYTAGFYNIPCNFVYTTNDALIEPNSPFDVNYWIKTEGVLLWQK